MSLLLCLFCTYIDARLPGRSASGWRDYLKLDYYKAFTPEWVYSVHKAWAKSFVYPHAIKFSLPVRDVSHMINFTRLPFLFDFSFAHRENLEMRPIQLLLMGLGMNCVDVSTFDMSMQLISALSLTKYIVLWMQQKTLQNNVSAFATYIHVCEQLHSNYPLQ